MEGLDVKYVHELKGNAVEAITEGISLIHLNRTT